LGDAAVGTTTVGGPGGGVVVGGGDAALCTLIVSLEQELETEVLLESPLYVATQ
jgi:hypothetical protein